MRWCWEGQWRSQCWVHLSDNTQKTCSGPRHLHRTEPNSFASSMFWDKEPSFKKSFFSLCIVSTQINIWYLILQIELCEGSSSLIILEKFQNNFIAALSFENWKLNEVVFRSVTATRNTEMNQYVDTRCDLFLFIDCVQSNILEKKVSL